MSTDPGPNESKRAEEPELDFHSVYANNVSMELSVWDLKMIFGQTEQHTGKTVDWHTAVTVPWMQAKIMAYILRLQVAWYEASNGKIHIPQSVLPVRLDDVPADGDQPRSVIEFFEFAKKLHVETFEV